MDYRQTIRTEASKAGLDPNLAEAMLLHESGGNQSAVSSKGAIGLTQLMPATARELGVDPTDPLQNIQGGVRYLKTQVDRFGVPGGIAAYNAGPTRVANTPDFGQLPEETRAYVPAVMNRAAAIASANAPSAPQVPTQTAEGPSVEKIVGAYEKATLAGDAEAASEIGGLLQQRFASAITKAEAAGDAPSAEELRSALERFKSGQATHPLGDGEKATGEPATGLAEYARYGRAVFKSYKGEEFKGSDTDAATWAKQFASDFRWNTATMGKVAMSSAGWSPEAKQAFLDLQKAYDTEKNLSGDTLGRVAESVLTDPLTYLTLGAGKVATKAGQAATEAAVRNALERSLAKRIVGSVGGKGAVEGAAIAGGQDTLHQLTNINTGGQEDFDLTTLGKSIGTGAGLGWGMGKLLDRLSGAGAVGALARNAGSEEGAKIDAEVVQRLSNLAENPNFRGQPVRAEQLNGIAGSFVKEAEEGLRTLGAKEIATQGADGKALRAALQNWKALSAEEVQGLRGTPLGDSVADSITKAQRVRSLTAEKDAAGGVLKVARGVVSALPLPAPLHMAAKAVLGGARSRKETVEQLIRPGLIRKAWGGSPLEAAQRITQDLGPSTASGASGTLQTLAQAALQRQAAAKAQATLSKAASKATDPAALIAEQQAKDPSYLLGLGNPLGAPRNADQMSEFSKVIKDQMERRAAQEAANKAKQTASVGVDAVGADVRNKVLQDTGRPLSGAFQELLPGGRSNLNLNSKQAVEALRLTSRQLKDSPVGEAAKSILKSGNVDNPDAFYGLQNHLRNLQEQGILSTGAQQPFGALTEATRKVKNPAAYQAAVGVRQKVYDKALEDLGASGLPKGAQEAAKKAIQELKHGRPSNAQAVLGKVEEHLSALKPEERAAVEDVLKDALRFYSE